MTGTRSKFHKKLTRRQLELIEALASGRAIPEAMAKCRVSEAIFRKWTSSQAFNTELAYRQQLAKAQSELLISRFIPVAASKLISLLESEKEETVRKACLDILQLTSRQSKTETTTAAKSSKVSLSPKMAEKMLKLLAEEKTPSGG